MPLAIEYVPEESEAHARSGNYTTFNELIELDFVKECRLKPDFKKVFLTDGVLMAKYADRVEIVAHVKDIEPIKVNYE